MRAVAEHYGVDSMMPPVKVSVQSRERAVRLVWTKRVVRVRRGAERGTARQNEKVRTNNREAEDGVGKKNKDRWRKAKWKSRK